MAVRVLVVDDSGFFRRRVCEILNATGDITVVGTASNGREALELVAKLNPDVITMDYEMPVMDGITAVRLLMQSHPTPVLMFSSLTYEGARVTFDALDAGAVDFLPKSFEDLTGAGDKIRRLLHDKILEVAKSGKKRTEVAAPASTPAPSTIAPPVAKEPAREPAGRGGGHPPATRTASAPAAPKPAPKPRAEVRRTPRREYKLVLIGTSTGGPVALQRIVTQLPANFPTPIILVQHMPATFTPAFAERLNRLSALEVRQVENGEQLNPGVAYIAPGGKQILIERSGTSPKVRIFDGDERLHYKPCIDVTFGSAAKMFGDKLLGVILTGMGADGREGCRLIKEVGGVVWAQDEATSVIYGMPAAVTQAGLADEILPLDAFASRLIDGVS
ncbi:MAG: chemotaxis response regulator protein-glutamate methylesterase [Hahellaceae bacterium]|jgi:two-component system chemotaxis response regulator CheB|nr:chemotaxis response regulator protein-glutamate methylesterase [Hahellaceae bacterium]